MRSVVVVLPASTWARMPIFRISERGVVRGITRFRKSVVNCAAGGRRQNRAFSHDRRPYVERRPRNGQPGNPPPTPKGNPLSHAVAAPLETGPLSPKIIGTPARCRPAARLGRVEPGLPSGPAMALEFILPLLLLALPVLGIRDQLRGGRPPRLRLCRVHQSRRWAHGFILIHHTVPAIVGVVRIVVRSAVPPQRGVVQRQRRKIHTQPEARPPPGTVPAIAPAPAVAASPAVSTAPAVAPLPAVAAVEPADSGVSHPHRMLRGRGSGHGERRNEAACDQGK